MTHEMKRPILDLEVCGASAPFVNPPCNAGISEKSPVGEELRLSLVGRGRPLSPQKDEASLFPGR